MTRTHIQTHALPPPLLVCCYIRQPGRESGSSNRAIRTPRDPIDLLIDPLLPRLVQTTVRVYTATTGKSNVTLQASAHVTAEDRHDKSSKRGSFSERLEAGVSVRVKEWKKRKISKV